MDKLKYFLSLFVICLLLTSFINCVNAKTINDNMSDDDDPGYINEIIDYFSHSESFYVYNKCIYYKKNHEKFVSIEDHIFEIEYDGDQIKKIMILA